MYSIQKVHLSDIPQLIEIAKSREKHVEFLGEILDETYFLNCLTKGDLPPIVNAKKEDYELYIVYFQSKPIGFFDLYWGYPQPGCVWISLFVIEVDSQKKGHGSFLVHWIEKETLKRHFHSIECGVSTHNQNALRFWQNQGLKLIKINSNIVHLRKEISA